jgi:hypothetical protein
MFAIRAALLALFLSLFSSSAALSARSSASSAKDSVFAALPRDASIVCSVDVGIPHASTWTRFTPWKARPKIVLLETDYEFGAETDLGLVVIPRGLGSPSLIALAPPPVPTLSPLRC